MSSLIIINIGDQDTINFINDIVRMTTIQIFIQFLFFINNPTEVVFFSIDFILLVIYIILGVCVYWLVINKLITFK